MGMRRDSTARSRQLGDELRAKRRAAGLSGVALCELLGWTSARLSKLENGERGTADVDVAAHLAVCGVTGAEFKRLLALSRASPGDVWVQPLGPEPADRLPRLLVERARATEITGYDTMLVPALLRAPDYVHAITSNVPVEMHLDRESSLRGVKTTFYVEEQALHRVIGGRAVMHDQMMHLLLSPATVRVVPSRFGFHGGVFGAFTLFDTVDDRPVVVQELLVGNAYCESAEHVARYRAALDAVAGSALDVERSRNVLAELADHFGDRAGSPVREPSTSSR
ncbi:helix-turn-helix domain-containing protein [Umezawaea beigongshangensis]|uniref:helix-turn-helix domain-containing protein n=1 Tax=Umezawaea beigongshangensis TaxID=2780383 RepID=UPI0018F14118|nr:helix-turn-helix transcriptional regulator [Umezawaea beigongshangensis]